MKYPPRKTIFLNRRELGEGVGGVARYINHLCEEQKKDAILYCVLDGAYMFTADLVRHCDHVEDVRFVHVRRNYPTPDPDPSIFPPLLPTDILGRYLYFFVDVVTEERVTFRKLFRSTGRKRNVYAVALIDKSQQAITSPMKNVFTYWGCPTDLYLYGYGMAPHRHLSHVGKMKREDV